MNPHSKKYGTDFRALRAYANMNLCILTNIKYIFSGNLKVEIMSQPDLYHSFILAL